MRSVHAQIVVMLVWAQFVCMAQTSGKHSVTLSDLETIRTADYLQLSPDGRSLAYTLNGEIWVVRTIPGSAPYRVAKGFFPVWSPKGHDLAFYSNSSREVQLAVLHLASRKIDQITKLLGGIDPDPRTLFYLNDGPFAYSWSPDGRKIIFASRTDFAGDESNKTLQKHDDNRPLVLTDSTPSDWTLDGVFCHFGNIRYKSGKLTFARDHHSQRETSTSQLFVVDIRRRKIRQLTTDNNGYFNPDWSPDGQKIVCAASHGNPMPYAAGITDIYLIDLHARHAVRLTSGNASKWMPRWSPDGQNIAYWQRVGLGGAQSVHVISANGGHSREVTAAIDRYIMDFHWAPEGSSIFVEYPDGVTWIMARISISDLNLVRLSREEPAVRMLLTVSRTGAMAWQESRPDRCGIIRITTKAGSSYILLDFNPQIRTWELGEQEVVVWKNHRGDAMEGVLIKPVGYKKGHTYPLIVDAYPGQSDNFKGSPMDGNQSWASHGEAVFWPNARAPHVQVGRFKSEAYDHEAQGPTGWSITVDDVTSGVDELVHRGIADPERMALYGFSNGGGIVNYLVTSTHRFKCAVSVGGALSDWLRPAMLDPHSWIESEEKGLDPWNNLNALVQLSAVFRLDQVTTPMLLADGDMDGNFLLDNIEMYNGLRHFGRPVTFLRYPNQGHGFTGNALRDFWERESAYFDRCLLPSQALGVQLTPSSPD